MWQVVGHGWAVRLLQRSLEEGRLSHAYLLAGPPQVGKTTLALEFGRAVLCQGAERPCDTCPTCQSARSGTHPDLRLVEGVGKGGAILIEQVREMRREAALAPVHGPRRIYVIPHMERATPEAANAFLKTLEEPPPQVLWLLTTDHVASLPPTITSRCQVLALRGVPVSEVGEALRSRWNLGEKEADLLARLSGGRLGWAVRAVQDDQVLRRRQEWLDALFQAAQESRGGRLSQAERLAALPDEQLDEVLQLWAGFWRDLLVWQGGDTEGIFNVDQKPRLAEAAQQLTLPDVSSALQSLLRTHDYLDRNVNRRLALEVMLLSLPSLP